jgi:hypothetical protein
VSEQADAGNARQPVPPSIGLHSGHKIDVKTRFRIPLVTNWLFRLVLIEPIEHSLSKMAILPIATRLLRKTRFGKRAS